MDLLIPDIAATILDYDYTYTDLRNIITSIQGKTAREKITSGIKRLGDPNNPVYELVSVDELQAFPNVEVVSETTIIIGYNKEDYAKLAKSKVRRAIVGLLNSDGIGVFMRNRCHMLTDTDIRLITPKYLFSIGDNYVTADDLQESDVWKFLQEEIQLASLCYHPTYLRYNYYPLNMDTLYSGLENLTSFDIPTIYLGAPERYIFGISSMLKYKHITDYNAYHIIPGFKRYDNAEHFYALLQYNIQTLSHVERFIPLIPDVITGILGTTNILRLWASYLNTAIIENKIRSSDLSKYKLVEVVVDEDIETTRLDEFLTDIKYSYFYPPTHDKAREVAELLSHLG